MMEIIKKSAINHYPGGVDDHNYCIPEFAIEGATLWTDNESITVRGEQI